MSRPANGSGWRARPDSAPARELANDIRRLFRGEIASDADRVIRDQLVAWTRAANDLERGLARGSRAPSGEEVAGLAAQQRGEYEKAGLDVPSVSVNVSFRRLHDDNLIPSLRDLPIKPGQLAFELLEAARESLR